MNTKIDRDENVDINHRERHIIYLMKEFIKKPFKLDPLPQFIIFQATTHPITGKGAKVIVQTFLSQSLVKPQMVYQHDRDVGYFRANKGRNKRKRDSPKKTKPGTKEPQDEDATQAQDTAQVPP